MNVFSSVSMAVPYNVLLYVKVASITPVYDVIENVLNKTAVLGLKCLMRFMCYYSFIKPHC